MKKLFILIATLGFVYACNKKTTQPQQVVTNNQITTPCDTVNNCWYASAQGTYTFAPGNGSDTTMTGCKVRMTFDGIKDSTAIHWGGVNNDSLVYYQYTYWYRMTCINFSSNIQTTNNFYNRLSCSKGSIFTAVSLYLKSGKRAIFHR